MEADNARTRDGAWTRFALALAFLSRLPVPGLDHATSPLGRCAWAFPVAGAVIAVGPVAFGLVAGLVGLPPLAVAALTVGAFGIITGALHEDGLADCADGFFGGRTVERRRAIMRDPNVGTYGVLALGLAVLLRVTLIAPLVSQPLLFAAALVACAATSRAAITVVWTALPPAPRADTLGGAKGESLSTMLGEPGQREAVVALVLGVAATVPLAVLSGPIGALAALVGAALGGAACARIALRRIGGHTGDVLGASQQSAELGFLLGLLATI